MPSSGAVKFGVDRLIADAALRAPLKGKRVALVAHPASVTADLTHSLDALAACGDVRLTAAFGPQHGMRGDKQDNMIESPDFTDPLHGIPVFSLYGEGRRPTGQMMDTFDIVLLDLQDVGCRIYTFITTLLYVIEAAAEHGKEVWVLDRPNPIGRPVEGLTLRAGWESFVGAGPIPMRHGLTLGELGKWFVDHFRLDVTYRVIEMEDYRPNEGPGFGWPLYERAWVNPSPNAPNLWMARAYAGTVMIEGATLSEGRGTTRPLELFGAPDIDAKRVIAQMQAFAPEWLTGCRLRDCWFEPTFHKHMKQLCNGVQIHTEDSSYDHETFKPWRVQALGFKAIRRLYPRYDLWRGLDFKYEYTNGELAIDVINGGKQLREWVDDPNTTAADLDAITIPDEQAWIAARKPYLLY
ncbi:MAG: exo-beta-N-acetylmuramidase NamZ family protein [Hyphomonadaceae bacterium]